MLKHKTQRRLSKAIKSVEDLESYLKRVLLKLDEEIEPPEDVDAFIGWLYEEARMWRTRRDAEPKSSETYRFFDGKSEGIECVIRYLEEQSGKDRQLETKGYLSAKDRSTSDHSTKLTATINMSNTVTEQAMT